MKYWFGVGLRQCFAGLAGMAIGFLIVGTSLGIVAGVGYWTMYVFHLIVAGVPK